MLNDNIFFAESESGPDYAEFVSLRPNLAILPVCALSPSHSIVWLLMPGYGPNKQGTSQIQLHHISKFKCTHLVNP